MSEVYEPTSRRHIADVFRKTAHGAVQICLKCHIHPDAVSYASMIAAAAAAICLWQSQYLPWLLLVAPMFCYLRLWCNMLDGMVAIASKKASLRGEILNEVPDRISDVIIFVGVAHSGIYQLELGYWAAIMAVFTAYIGTFGQAVGVQREFSGIMAKPWRMVMVHLGAWTTWVLLYTNHTIPCKLTVLDWTCIIVIIGCLQTITIRLHRILKALKQKAAQ